MFKDLYKKANDCIKDDALKEKILNPQPVKRHSFVPAYSYGTVIAAVIALVVFFSNQGKVENQPITAKNEPVKYQQYQGEKLLVAEKTENVKARTVEDASEALYDTAEIEISVNAPAVYIGRFDDILYNTGKENKSYALSPFSLENAISIALNGADENTKACILSAFNMESTDAQNLKMNNIIRQYNSSDRISINIANSIWINKDRTDARFKPDFETAVFNSYNAESHTVGDNNGVKAVNSWVSSNTKGKIDSIISDSDFEGLIVNTVYFKGSFENKFNKKLTKKDEFTGNGIKYERDFMEQTSYLNYGKSEDVEIVKLPYISDTAEVSMYVLMGEGKVLNPVSLIENTPLSKTYINLKMPKFEYSYQTSLMPALNNMGIESLTLSNMTDGELSAFDIIQKTYINTDEEGTEAAAATGILMGAVAFTEKPEPYQLKIDKDFTFVIYDETNKVALFTGEVK